MNGHILFVDDDPDLRKTFEESFRARFAFETACGGPDALKMVESRGPYSVVVVDACMPGMAGVDLLERLRELSPDTARIMLTGNSDQETAIDAVNRGRIFRFLNKPILPATLLGAIEAGLEHHVRLRGERELIEGTLAGCVKLLTDVLGLSAPEALGRGQRLRDSIRVLAQHLGLTSTWEMELGALLSEIGCAAVPPARLAKAAAGEQLVGEEREILRRVPRIGHDLIADIPRLAGVAAVVLYQDQHFDGTGFPGDGLKGAALPIGARLLKILHDRLELENDGVVKRRAFETMQARRGTYDPDLLVACFACFGDFLIHAVSAERPVLTLPTARLAPGQIVVSDVLTRDGVLLVRAGNRLTSAMIQRLQNFAELGELNRPLLIQEAAPAP